MSSQSTQYTSAAPVMPYPTIESYHDFNLFDDIEPSAPSGNTPLFSDKDESFLQRAIGLSHSELLESTIQQEPTQTISYYPFNYETVAITPYQTSYEDSPIDSPFTDFFPTPFIEAHGTPFFTPYATPYEDFENDPLLSPAIFNELEKDEGYGTTEFKRTYSPDRFDGNPSTLLHTAEKPIIDFAEFDPEETTGNLIEPLGSSSYMNETSVSQPLDRKRKSSSSSDSGMPIRRFSCKYPGCDKAFARLFNLNTHSKTHDPNREKPFSCKDCSKSFARKHDLYRHEASVHRGERLFTCKRCTKPFSRKDALRRHVAIKGCPGITDNDVEMESNSTSGSDESSPEM